MNIDISWRDTLVVVLDTTALSVVESIRLLVTLTHITVTYMSMRG